MPHLLVSVDQHFLHHFEEKKHRGNVKSNCIIRIFKYKIMHFTPKKSLHQNLMMTKNEKAQKVFWNVSTSCLMDFHFGTGKSSRTKTKHEFYLGWWPLGFWACICIKYLLLNVVPSPTLVARGNVLVDPLDFAESESEICTPALPPLSVLSLRKLSLWVLKPLKEHIKLSEILS